MKLRLQHQNIRLRPIQLIKTVRGIDPDHSTHASEDPTVMCMDAPALLPAGSMLQMPPRSGTDFFWTHERICLR